MYFTRARLAPLVLAVISGILLIPALLPGKAHAVPTPLHFETRDSGIGKTNCEWSGIGAGTASLKLYRGTSYGTPLPGAAQLIWEGSVDATGFVDTPPTLGINWYALVAIGTDGSTVSRVDGVVLGPNYSGGAYDTAGRPLSGIEVWIYPRSRQNDPGAAVTTTTVTLADGTFALKLPVGGYYAFFHDPSGRYMDEWFGGGHDFIDNTYRYVYSDISWVSGVNGYLEQPTYVSGTVWSDFTGQPLPGVGVTLCQVRHDGTPVGSSYNVPVIGALTDADGGFRLPTTAGTEYYLVYAGASHIGTQTPVFDVAEGDLRVEADVWLHPEFDHDPPVSRFTVDSRWRSAPALAWVQATDDRDGVASTYVSLDGAAETTLTGPMTFSADGEYEVAYRSVDRRGNREATKTVAVRVDSVAPTTTAVMEPAATGAAVRMTLSASDDRSGVAATYVRYDGVTRIYSDPLVLEGPADTLVEFWSVDRAGNSGAVNSERMVVGMVPPTPVPTGDPADSSRWSWWNPGAPTGVADADIDMEEAAPLAATAAPVTVAMVGSGIYLDDPDLQGQLWVNEDEIADNDVDDDGNGYVDDVHGARFGTTGVSGDNDVLWGPFDGWRATSWAGIVAAKRNNGYGISGIAPNARIMSLPVMSEAGSYAFTSWAWSPAVDAAIRYAVDNGAKVIQLNATGGTEAGLQYAADHGVLVVVPSTAGSLSASSSATNTVVVGLSDRSDQPVEYGWSRGAHVDLVAPADAPASSGPRYAGLFVDNAPYRVAYLSMPAEEALMPNRDQLIGRSLRMVAPDTSTPVLVVDASLYRNSGGLEAPGFRTPPYVQAAKQAGYSSVSVFDGLVPTASDMAGKAVLFCGGVNYAHVTNIGIYEETLAEMAKFLDGGGSLVFVSGELGTQQEIGWIDDRDGFYARYLHALYLGETLEQAYEGVPGSVLGGLSFTHQGGDEPECLWPADAKATPIAKWPSIRNESGGQVAASHVTGVAALLLGRNPGWSAEQVKNRLVTTVDVLPQLVGTCETGGRLNAYKALSGTAKEPKARLTALAAPGAIRRNRAFTATGYLMPQHPADQTAVVLKCYRLEAGKWVLQRSFRALGADAPAATRYGVRVALPSKGTWRLVALHEDAEHSVSASPARVIQVR